MRWPRKRWTVQSFDTRGVWSRHWTRRAAMRRIREHENGYYGYFVVPGQIRVRKDDI